MAKNKINLVDLVSESGKNRSSMTFHDPRVQSYLKWLKRLEDLEEQERDLEKRRSEIEDERQKLNAKVKAFKVAEK